MRLFKKKPSNKTIDEDCMDNTRLEQLHFFTKTLGLILDNKFDVAYKQICKRNSEMLIPPGLNCDWEKRYKRGITENWLRVSAQSMRNTTNPMVTAASIYSIYSGVSSRDVADMLISVSDTYYSSDEIRQEIRYVGSELSSDLNFISYEECGIKKYRYLASLDEHTCPICGHLDGKIFFVNERERGVNCPPMHDGCRCTTISVVDKNLIDKMQRFARDSNGRGIKVPGSMNWREWRNRYLTKE
ncbi:MAG: minor capsid protein [Ruminococcus sp.]|nr:minor capsid protein [Ruminococcus sp.]